MNNLKQLEEKLEYTFKNPELLKTALTHSSWANEHGDKLMSYERQEFLGDAVLGFVTAEYLWQHEPAIPEGIMTRLRASLVCENSLYAIAQELGLGDYMLLGRGEEHSGGRERVSILADMVEAIIAGVYLDSGIDPVRRLVRRLLLDRAEISVEAADKSEDYKTELQELVQRSGESQIVYEEVSESGPDHNKEFTFKVTVNGEKLGTGTGRRKKAAEQMAAKEALENFGK